MPSWPASRGVRLRELDAMSSLAGALPELSLEFDQTALDRLTRDFAAFPGAVKMALQSATEITRQATRREFVSGFRRMLTLKPAYIASGIKSRKAKGASPAEIRIATGRIPLIRYAVKPELPPILKGVAVKSRPRVSYRLRSSGSAYGDSPRGENAPSGAKLFVQRMKSGHIGVFYRAGKGIGEDYGPSLQYHAYAEGFLPGMEAFVRKRFETAFREEAAKISGVEWK